MPGGSGSEVGEVGELPPIYSNSIHTLEAAAQSQTLTVAGILPSADALGATGGEDSPFRDIFFGNGRVWRSQGAGKPLAPVCSLFVATGEGRDPQGRPMLCLSFRCNGGKAQTATILRSTIARGDREFVPALTDAGFWVTNEKQGRAVLQTLLNSLSPPRAIVAHQLGWIPGDDVEFVLPDRVIGAKGNTRVIANSDIDRELRVGQRGTFEGWRAEIAAKAVGNSRLQLMLALAFTAPLLAFAPHVTVAATNLFGESGDGKSVSQSVLGSVWGGSDQTLGYNQSCNATPNALLARAMRLNGIPLSLDEVSLIKPEHLNDLVYQLASGQERGRLNRDSTLRASQSWRTITLLTGEAAIQEHAALASRDSVVRGGVDSRALNIPSDTCSGFKAFENIHGAPTGQHFAEDLINATRRNFGHAGPMFVEQLVSAIGGFGGRDAFESKLRADVKANVLLLDIPQDAAVSVNRVAEFFGLAMTAIDLANKWDTVSGSPEDARAGMLRCWKSFVVSRSGTGSTTTRAQLIALREFILTQQSRFITVDMMGEAQAMVPNNVAGYRKEKVGDAEYYMLPSTWKQICGAAPRGQLADELKRLDLLIPGTESGRDQRKLTVDGRTIRAYCVSGRITEVNEDGSIDEPEAKGWSWEHGNKVASLSGKRKKGSSSARAFQ